MSKNSEQTYWFGGFSYSKWQAGDNHQSSSNYNETKVTVHQSIKGGKCNSKTSMIGSSAKEYITEQIKLCENCKLAEDCPRKLDLHQAVEAIKVHGI